MKTTENTVHAAARVQQSGNPSVEYVKHSGNSRRDVWVCCELLKDRK